MLLAVQLDVLVKILVTPQISGPSLTPVAQHLTMTRPIPLCNSHAAPSNVALYQLLTTCFVRSVALYPLLQVLQAA